MTELLVVLSDVTNLFIAFLISPVTAMMAVFVTAITLIAKTAQKLFSAF